MKKIGAREVVQCPNNNCFLGLDVDVSLAGCPIGHQIVRDAPNIAINKKTKHHAFKCQKLPLNKFAIC